VALHPVTYLLSPPSRTSQLTLTTSSYQCMFDMTNRNLFGN
jgi:hypothetical protein